MAHGGVEHEVRLSEPRHADFAACKADPRYVTGRGPAHLGHQTSDVARRASRLPNCSRRAHPQYEAARGCHEHCPHLNPSIAAQITATERTAACPTGKLLSAQRIYRIPLKSRSS